jgi:hypothetical protein
MMHTPKKKRKITKKKSRYRDWKLETTIVTPPTQHQKINFSIMDASKKETMHKRCRRPIIDLRFSPWRKSSLSKQCLQQEYWQIKLIKADLGFSPWKIELWTSPMQLSPHTNRCLKSRSSKPISAHHQDPITIALPSISAFITLSTNIMKRKWAPWY